MTLYREPGCTCLELADAMAYDLEELEQPLCRIHQGAEIAERDAAKVRDDAEHRAAVLGEVIDSLRDPDPICSCPTVAQGLRAALEGRDVEACAAHPPAPPVGSSSMPLNGDPILRSLKASLGIPADSDPDGWHPPDAA